LIISILYNKASDSNIIKYLFQKNLISFRYKICFKIKKQTIVCIFNIVSSTSSIKMRLSPNNRGNSSNIFKNAYLPIYFCAANNINNTKLFKYESKKALTQTKFFKVSYLSTKTLKYFLKFRNPSITNQNSFFLTLGFINFKN